MYVMRSWAWWMVVAGVVGTSGHELDPASCAARFDVQRDKIIRTEESREMGARYLSELDVGSRTECLRLCCETDSCDVFVFEEKNPGSCYLFNCGPPEDFRCKFTVHGNFSSGVLALSRRLAELQDQERLAHHERELANLRSPTSTTTTTAAPVHSSAAPRPPPEPPRPPPEPPRSPPESPRPPQEPPPPIASRCSRYQFECRRGGECIAVYNACDGVPQCADGSDEAPELGCPPSAASEAPRPAPPPPPTQPPPPPPLLTQIEMQESGDDSGDIAAGGSRDALAAGAERWPHRLTQAQPQRRYGAGSGNSIGSSHIFSHKGGLLQDNAFEPPAPPAPRPPWPQRAWQPPLTGAEGIENERGWSPYGRVEWPDVEPRRAWPVPQPRPEPDIPLYMPSKTMPEMPMMYSSQQQTLRDSPKKGFELMSKGSLAELEPSPPARPAPRPPAPADTVDLREEKKPLLENTTKKKVLKDTAVESSQVSSVISTGNGGHDAHSAALAASDHWPHDDHDGLSDHPPAAVLLLVLGSLMTVSLGGMLLCRARAARRRRRAHPRLAMDADYLVNGMYL